jgi:uncharacterized membrane protein
MRVKAVSMLFLILGALVLAQAVQQANQYWTTQPVVKQSLKLIEQQEAQAAALQISASDIAESKAGLREMSDVYVQVAVIDAILGLILVFLGVLYYPVEKPSSRSSGL